MSRAFKTPRVLAVLPAAALLASACGSGLIGSSKTPPEEVERLKREIVELKQRATVAELEQARLKREVSRLETELGQIERAEEAARAIEPNKPAPIGLDQKIEESDLEAPPVVADPVAADPVAADPVAADPVVGQAPPAPAQDQPTAEAQALYDQGYNLFHEQRYAEAETRFSRFAELYPGTNLADNALFWVGESRYARDDFTGALEAFSDTVARYPHGNKVSDALYKAGKCLESLGETQQATRTYREVVERYPGSAAAAHARDRLGEIP